jgi:hypothetical protein
MTQFVRLLLRVSIRSKVPETSSRIIAVLICELTYGMSDLFSTMGELVFMIPTSNVSILQIPPL